MAGLSRPLPHSTSLNVLTPKCRKNVRSSRIHADWFGRGSVCAAFAAIAAGESPAAITCSVA